MNHRLEARLLLERLHQPVGPGGEVEGSGRGDHQSILPQPPASPQSPAELRIGLGRLMEAAGVDHHIGIGRQSGVLPQQAHTGVVVDDREARAAHGPTAELLPALRAVASVAAGFDFIHQAETGAARQGGEQPNHGQGILAGTGEAVEVPPPAAEEMAAEPVHRIHRPVGVHIGSVVRGILRCTRREHVHRVAAAQQRLDDGPVWRGIEKFRHQQEMGRLALMRGAGARHSVTGLPALGGCSDPGAGPRGRLGNPRGSAGNRH